MDGGANVVSTYLRPGTLFNFEKIINISVKKKLFSPFIFRLIIKVATFGVETFEKVFQKKLRFCVSIKTRKAILYDLFAR